MVPPHPRKVMSGWVNYREQALKKITPLPPHYLPVKLCALDTPCLRPVLSGKWGSPPNLIPSVLQSSPVQIFHTYFVVVGDSGNGCVDHISKYMQVIQMSRTQNANFHLPSKTKIKGKHLAQEKKHCFLVISVHSDERMKNCEKAGRALLRGKQRGYGPAECCAL